MSHVRFSGFSAGLFQFFSALAENNSREWFDAHRYEYQSEVLTPIKSFVADLGPIIHMLNEAFDTEPRVGRTISRINNDLRFHRNRPPYRPWMYVGFPRRGENWKTGSLLFVGLEAHGVSVGFYPGSQPRRTGWPGQQLRPSDNSPSAGNWRGPGAPVRVAEKGVTAWTAAIPRSRSPASSSASPCSRPAWHAATL